MRVRPSAAAERLHRVPQADSPLAWIGVAPDDNAVDLIEPPLECDIVEPAHQNVAEFEWIRGTRYEVVALAAANRDDAGGCSPPDPSASIPPGKWG